MPQFPRLALLCIASLLAGGIAAAETSVYDNADTDVRARLVELVNRARATPQRCGEQLYPAAAPLAHSPLLDRAADEHASDMALHDYFEHEGSDGRQPHERLADLGYHSTLTGENIAYGPKSAEDVVRGWLASPGHCANIMDARFREIGVAYAISDRRHRVYWVQDFARP